jgi:hypothetical protein
MGAMEAAKEPSDLAAVILLLSEIRDELKDLREAFSSFSADGLPLRSQVPTSELMATLAVATGLIAKADPRMGQTDLSSRIEASPVIGNALVRTNDHFMEQSTPMRLSELLRGAMQ